MSKKNVMHDDSNPVYTTNDRRTNIIMRLSNFKTYGKAEVKIPRNSTTLINGPSGVGKTTLMNAFLYAFYNAVNHPERFNTQRCWVWIFIGDVIIYRQKSPGLLKVWVSGSEHLQTLMTDEKPLPIEGGDKSIPYGKEYTGEEAQNLINNRFGSQNLFLASSYLRQKEFSLFLSGTDAEKLALIKEISTKGCETDELKAPIKDRLRQYESHSLTTRAQLDMAIKSIQQFDNSYPSLKKQQEESSKDKLTPEQAVDKVKELRNRSALLDAQYRVVLQNETNLNAQRTQLAQYTGNYERDSKILADLLLVDHATILESIENDIRLHNNSTSSEKDIAAEALLKHQIAAYKTWKVKHDSMLKMQETMVIELQKLFKLDSDNSDLLPELTEENFKLKIDEYNSKILESDALDGKRQNYNLLLSNSGYGSIENAKKELDSLSANLETKKSELAEVSEVIEQHRLNRKWDCPECETTVILSSDGDSLQRSVIQSEKTKSVSPSPESAPPITTPPAVQAPLYTSGPKLKSIPGMINNNVTKPSAIPAPVPVPATIVTDIKKPEKCKFEHQDFIDLTTEVVKLENSIVHIVVTIKSLEEAYSLIDHTDVEKAKDLKSVSDLRNLSNNISNRWSAYNNLLVNVKSSTESEPDKVEEEAVNPEAVDDVKKHELEAQKLKELKIKQTNTKALLEKVTRYTIMKEQYETYIDSFKTSIKAFEEALNGQSAEKIVHDMHDIQANIDRLMHFNSTNDLVTQRYILEKTLEEKTSRATSAEKEHAACKRLLEKAVEAERISLESAVDELNLYLAEYLNRLFIHAPITVEISTTRTLKSKKTTQKFDLQIFYGQSSYDSVQQLSGGEKDRVSLAMTMAMNKKFGGTLLFLDETLSSFDSELKGEVVGLLKDFSSGNRTVITVSHEETEGLYDQVIRIPAKQ
jgi:DNA repair exonuclease SbcCD ATPase subunit